MKLRGHHLICRLGFQGLGYDDKFTQTMKEVLTILDLNPNLNIKVTTSIDILCAACPHREDNICSQEEKEIPARDQFILDNLGLTEDRVYTLQEINQKIRNQFTESKRQQLCRNCEWNQYGYCQQGLAALKEPED